MLPLTRLMYKTKSSPAHMTENKAQRIFKKKPHGPARMALQQSLSLRKMDRIPRLPDHPTSSQVMMLRSHTTIKTKKTAQVEARVQRLSSISQNHIKDFNEMGKADEDDSCEANADERESVLLSADFNEESATRRWDHFPPLSNSDNTEDELVTIQNINRQSLQNERPKAANICGLLRSDRHDKPAFVKQNFNRSLKGSNSQKRINNFSSPNRPAPVKVIIDSEFTGPFKNSEPRRTTLTQSVRAWNSFLQVPQPSKQPQQCVSPLVFAVGTENMFRRRDESPNDEQRNSAQQLPMSRPSMRSIFGSKYQQRRNLCGSVSRSPPSRFSKLQQDTSYQQKARIGLTAKMATKDNINLRLKRDDSRNDTDKQRVMNKELVQQPYRRLGQRDFKSQITTSPGVYGFEESKHEARVGLHNNSQQQKQQQQSQMMMMKNKSVHINENCFDHLGLPDSATNFEKRLDQKRSLTKSLHNDRRILRKNTGPAHRKVGSFGGGLEDIDERNNDISNNSIANYCYSPSNVMEETIAPVVPVDDFSSDFKSSKLDRPIYQLKSAMGKSFEQQQEDARKIESKLSDYQRSMLGISTNRNLMSIIQAPSMSDSSPPSANSTFIQQRSIHNSSQKQHSQAQGSHNCSVSEKSESVAAGSSVNEESQQPSQSVGWLQSFTWGVSKLFTGSAAPETVPEEETDVVELDDDVIEEGEIPDEDCDKEELSFNFEIRSKNTDVRRESTRMHGGHSLRKKILFIESSVTQKGASGKMRDVDASRSNYESLFNAQSYNQILSDSEATSLGKVSRKQADMISFTTSQREKFTPNKGAAAAYPQRPSSSSFHNNPGRFGNNFSSLLSGRHAGIGQQSSGTLSPNHKKIEESRFKDLSRFFGKETQTNGNEERVLTTRFDKTGGLLLKKSSITQQWTGRKHSKTLNFDCRPFLSLQKSTKHEVRKAEEKVRPIDHIVFNQNKTHFAVIWQSGGFDKFDVATLQVIQRVQKTPPSVDKSQAEDTIATVPCVDRQHHKARQLGHMQISKPVFSKNNVPDSSEVVPDNDDQANFQHHDDESNDEQDVVQESEKFKCLALQHNTRDYVATLASDPTMVIYVHVNHEIDQSSLTKNLSRRRTTQKPQLGQRTLVKYFQEDVSRIEILPEARYTLICLQSAIYIYSKNSSELYDIVPCFEPSISSAIYRTYEQRIVIAYLSAEDPGETIEVHDYTLCPRSGTDTIYTIAKPFSTGYKIGAIQLDELGHRIVVVSEDGCYVYLYSLEEQAEEEQQAQDQAIPGYDFLFEAQAMLPSKAVTIKAPLQSFARAATRCNEIYKPVQIVEGFSVQNHVCDFILLSSSQMITHMFSLKTPAELEEDESLPKEKGGFFSRFLPQTFTLDSSKVRLNILEELAPAEPLIVPSGRLSSNIEHVTIGLAFQNKEQKEDDAAREEYEEKKKQLSEFPYTCFIESSGLLVAISYSGYCCKFSIDLQSDPSLHDLRQSGFHSMRQSHFSPKSSRRGTNKSGLYLSTASLTHSLSQIKIKSPLKRKTSPRLTRGAITTRQNSLKQPKQLVQQRTSQPTDFTEMSIQQQQTPKKVQLSLRSKTQTVQFESQTPTAVSKGQPMSEAQTPILTKRSMPFYDYRQPVLRLKFKMQDFFMTIDHKKDSLKRIRQNKLQLKRLQEYKELLQEMHQMRALRQGQDHGDESKEGEKQVSKISQLKRLLTGAPARF